MKTRMKLGPLNEYFNDLGCDLKAVEKLWSKEFRSVIEKRKILCGEEALPDLKAIFMCLHSRLLKALGNVDKIESLIGELWESVEFDSGHGGDLWDLMPLDLIRKEQPLAIFKDRKPIGYLDTDLPAQ
jgi:hypothetical protein